MLISLFIAILLGTVFGSFTSMASYRLPRGEGMVMQRSHCTHCQHVLGVKDLVPVFSWLWNRGKCRYCHKAVSPAYLLHELTLGLVFALVFFVYGYSILTLILWAVAVCLVILVAVDLEHTYLPDSVQIILAVLGGGYGFFIYPEWIQPLLGCVCYALLGWGLRWFGFMLKKTEALGWGDVKFFAVAGLFLGLNPAHAALFFLCSGLAGMLTALIWKLRGKGALFPFGPALAVALMVTLLLAGVFIR